MSHDEIRDYLERIERKVDDLTTELGGDKNTVGIRTQLHELQEHRKSSQRFAWYIITAICGLALHAAWKLLTGKP